MAIGMLEIRFGGRVISNVEAILLIGHPADVKMVRLVLM